MLLLTKSANKTPWKLILTTEAFSSLANQFMQILLPWYILSTTGSILWTGIVGFCSLLIYLWQFLLETDETRSLTLAGFSQMFSASTPLYLFGGIARLVESQPNYVGRATMVAMQVIALVYMIIVFCIGIYWKKRKKI